MVSLSLLQGIFPTQGSNPGLLHCRWILNQLSHQSLLKFMFIELMMLSNHLILRHPLFLLPSILPSIRSFPMSQLFTSGGQHIGASASILPMNIQGGFLLGLTGFITLQSKRLSRIFSSTIQKHQFFSSQPSLWSNSHIRTWLLEKI